jgi:hypothetical protein
VIGHGALTYAWTGGVQDSTLFTPGATNTYTVTGSDGNNCSNTGWITVTVNSLPAITINATDTSVCAGTSVTLTGGGGSSYAWTNGVTDGIAFPATSSNTYSLTGTDGNGCTNTSSVFIHVNSLPQVVAHASDASICQGSSVTLNGSGAVSYIWQGNQTNGIQDGVSFTPASSDTYSVTGTDLNNCSNMATVPVNVNAMPVNTTTIYSGDVISADQSNATYQWLDCDSSGMRITDEDRQFIVGAVHNSYAVIISMNGCTDTSACVELVPTGISEITKENTIGVYPNPNNGTFTLQSLKGGDYTIVDQLGNVIRTVKIAADSNYTMTLDNVSSGIYFVIGVNNNEVTRLKLVITK